MSSNLKRTLFLTGLIILGLIGANYYLRKESSPVSTKLKQVKKEKNRKAVAWQDITNAIAANQETDVRTKSTEPAAQATPAGETAETQDTTLALDKICDTDWQHVARIELTLFQHQVGQGMFAMTTDCSQAMLRTLMSSNTAWFVRNCQPSVTITPGNRDACINLAMN